MSTHDPNEGRGGTTQRTDMVTGSTSITSGSTASEALAAQAQAKAVMRWGMARKHPRHLDDVRTSLRKECTRPAFAEAAWYRREQGAKWNPDTRSFEPNFVEGFSIRFAEDAIRKMTNMSASSVTLVDDDDRRITRVTVEDLETNADWQIDIVTARTVERSNAKGREVLGSRPNSRGKTTFIVRATEEEMVAKVAAAVSKAARTLILRHIPGDILDECRAQIHATKKAGFEKDPTAARRRLVDAFAELGVKAADLVELLGGRALDTITSDDHLRLQGIWAALRDREMTWADVVAANSEGDAEEDEKAKATREALAKKQADLKAKADAARAKKAAAGATQPKDAAAGEAPPSPAPATDGPAKPAHDPAAGEVDPKDEPPGREPGED